MIGAPIGSPISGFFGAVGDSSISASFAVPTEWISSLPVDHEVQVDWLLAVQAYSIIPYGSIGSVSRLQSIAFGWLATTNTADPEVSVEWANDLVADAVMPDEWAIRMATNRTIPVSYGSAVSADANFNARNLAGVGTNVELPVLWARGAAKDFVLPITWYIPLQVDQVIPVDYKFTPTFVVGNHLGWRTEPQGLVWRTTVNGVVFSADPQGTNFSVDTKSYIFYND